MEGEVALSWKRW